MVWNARRNDWIVEEAQAFDDFSLVLLSSPITTAVSDVSFLTRVRQGGGLTRLSPKRPVAALPLIQIFNPEIGYKTRVPLFYDVTISIIGK